MRVTSSVLLEILRGRLWVVPSVAAVLAALLAAAVLWLDAATDSFGVSWQVGAANGRAVLSAIAGAMISFTALVFSITMLVLQAASTQLSPRVIRTFLRDRANQSVLGLFVATFVYSLLVLTAVTDDYVPLMGVLVAVVLVLLAVLAFVAYIDHMAHDIRPTSVIETIAAEALAVIGRVYPDPANDGSAETGSADRGSADEGPADEPQPIDAQRPPSKEDVGLTVTWSGGTGYIQAFDQKSLLAFAGEQKETVELLVGTGSFVVSGLPLLWVPGASSRESSAEDLGLGDAIRVGAERTMAQDPEFGFRQLVDVALRALSPSLNDPTTAIQAIDRLHELLRELMSRSIPSPVVLRSEVAPQVRVPAPDWDHYVHLSTWEIGLACRSLPQVARHLHQVLGILLDDAPPQRRAALRRAQAALHDVTAADLDS